MEARSGGQSKAHDPQAADCVFQYRDQFTSSPQETPSGMKLEAISKAYTDCIELEAHVQRESPGLAEEAR